MCKSTNLITFAVIICIFSGLTSGMELPIRIGCGNSSVIVDGDKVELSARQCIIVEPGELHSIPEVSEDIDMIYFGIEE